MTEPSFPGIPPTESGRPAMTGDPRTADTATGQRPGEFDNTPAQDTPAPEPAEPRVTEPQSPPAGADNISGADALDMVQDFLREHFRGDWDRYVQTWQLDKREESNR